MAWTAARDTVYAEALQRHVTRASQSLERRACLTDMRKWMKASAEDSLQETPRATRQRKKRRLLAETLPLLQALLVANADSGDDEDVTASHASFRCSLSCAHTHTMLFV